MTHYPLRERGHAITDDLLCVHSFADIVNEWLADSDGQYPIEAPVLLANAAAARAAILAMMPASLDSELAMEKLRYADDEAFHDRQ